MPLTKREFLEAIIDAVEEGKEIKLETRVCEARKAYLSITALGLGLMYQIPLSSSLPIDWEERLLGSPHEKLLEQKPYSEEFKQNLLELTTEVREVEAHNRQKEARLYMNELKVTFHELGYIVDESHRIRKIPELEPEPKTWRGLLKYFTALISNGKKSTKKPAVQPKT
jgi:hypothetical protein